MITNKFNREEYNELPNIAMRWAFRNTGVQRAKIADELKIPLYSLEWVMWHEVSSDFENEMIAIIQGFFKGKIPEHLTGDAFVDHANKNMVENYYAANLRKGV